MVSEPDSEFSPASEMDSAHFDQSLQRLKIAAEAQNDSDLAKFLGIHPQSITNARTKKKIPFQWYFTLGLKANVSVDWLLDGKGPMQRGLAAKEGEYAERCLTDEDYEMVPLLESRVTAGPEGEILFEEVADYYPFKRWWVERMVGKDKERKARLVLIKVRGDSMSPTINPGEVAMIDTWEAERINIRTGQIYVITMPDGSSAMKRLAISEQVGKVRLICMSDNVAAYRPFEFELESGRPLAFYVLGRVRWVGKEFD